MTSVRLLDSFCYTNVFVDEGRQTLGVKIDKKTPKVSICLSLSLSLSLCARECMCVCVCVCVCV